MTDSKDEKKVPKAKKPKGPLRTELFVPVFIVIGLIVAYVHFFLDSHIKWGIEKGATYIHGAQVDLAQFQSSLFGGNAKMLGLQITDKEQPEKNLIEIGEMRFEFLWDALLRAKIVINDASIIDIKLASPRKRKGWVRPPEPPGQESNALAKLENTVLTQLEDQNQENLLGSISQLAQGMDEKDILKNIEGELKAEKRINELKNSLKEKEKLWKERIDSLAGGDEFKKLEARAKELKFDTKNPVQFASDLKTIKEIAKEAEAKVNEIKKSGKDLKGDIGSFSRDISSIDDWVKQDIEDIEKRLKIPKLDAAAFSKSLFMKMFSDKLVSVQKYSELAKEYVPLPNKKKSEAEKIIPRERGKGRTYLFPVKTGYPLFWLKRSEITSRSTPGGLSGDLDGLITNVTNNQVLIDQPTLAQIKGSFPNQNIQGILGLAKMDHRKEPFEKSLELIVGSYPLKNLVLSNSKSVKLAVTETNTASQFNASLIGENINIELKNQFRSPEYAIEADSSTTQRILNDVIGKISLITLDANAKGRWDKLRLDIDTNLGRAISDSFQAFMKTEIASIKEKIRAQVDSRIQGEKEKLEAEYAKLKNSVEKVMSKKDAEVDKAKSGVDKMMDSTSNKKSEAKDKLKEKGKELLKKLKF